MTRDRDPQKCQFCGEPLTDHSVTELASCEADIAVIEEYAAASCSRGDHSFVPVFTRSWRQLWRKQMWRRCWDCDFKEPM